MVLVLVFGSVALASARRASYRESWLASSESEDLPYNDLRVRYEELRGRRPDDEELASVVDRDLARTFPKAPLFQVRCCCWK